MTVNELLEYFDNWNIDIVINNSNLDCIYKNSISNFWDERNLLLRSEVDSFGFYDNELCVRICEDK
jgi:hypothetical protein